MAAQTAKIIDLDEHRRLRRAELAHDRAYDSLPLTPAASAMTWMPVWFVPVFFVGSPANLG